MARSRIPFRSLAVVSGKGGSGKTLVATAIAQTFARSGSSVVLVDADFGTGGLTYYLGFGAFKGVRYGLSDFVQAPSDGNAPFLSTATSEAIERDSYFAQIKLLPVGNHRLLDGRLDSVFPRMLRKLLDHLTSVADLVIFDCRGGVDEESLAVCSSVERIVMVVETDAAAVQASQHLVGVLDDKGMGQKLSGFILNKVLDDPTTLASAGRTFFRSEFLGAIPFDIETTRAFIKGEIPRQSSLFVRHVRRAIATLAPHSNIDASVRVLRPDEFASIALRNPNVRLGSLALGTLTAYGAIASAVFALPLGNTVPIGYFLSAVIVAGVLVVAALSDVLKQTIGEGLAIYVRGFAKLLGRSRGD